MCAGVCVCVAVFIFNANIRVDYYYCIITSTINNFTFFIRMDNFLKRTTRKNPLIGNCCCGCFEASKAKKNQIQIHNDLSIKL